MVQSEAIVTETEGLFHTTGCGLFRQHTAPAASSRSPQQWPVQAYRAGTRAMLRAYALLHGAVAWGGPRPVALFGLLPGHG
jgi:hypothetical protein